MSEGRRVAVVGRLMNEPKLRRGGPGGAPSLKMKLAVTRWGEDETATFEASVRGRLAEICAGSLEKGQSVVVAGSLKAHRAKAANGEDLPRLAVVADRVQVMKPKRRTRDGDQS